jgi:hypothetical protein
MAVKINKNNKQIELGNIVRLRDEIDAMMQDPNIDETIKQ